MRCEQLFDGGLGHPRSLCRSPGQDALDRERPLLRKPLAEALAGEALPGEGDQGLTHPSKSLSGSNPASSAASHPSSMYLSCLSEG